MKSSLRFLGAAAAVAFAGAARAGDLPMPALTWQGFHIGAHAGGGIGTSTTGNAILQAVYGSVPRLTGGLGGLQIGYDYQFANNVVLGAEFDITRGWLASRIGIAPASFASGTMDWFGSLRARLGYAFDRVLIFATAGVSQVRTSGHGFNAFFPAGFTTGNTHSGWVYGGGVEYALTANWFIGAEYIHGAYDKQIYVAAPRDGLVDIFRARVDYKF